MKKLLVIAMAFFALSSYAAQGLEMPDWVKQQPQKTSQLVYFTGSSEKSADVKNYLEARAGALASVLVQFSMYKGADIKDSLLGYDIEYFGKVEDPNRPYEGSMTEISFTNNSAGLYQQGEWIAADGTVHLLFTFSPGGRTNPRPDFSAYFKNFVPRNDRVYFIAQAVSPQNNSALAAQAEQNAKTQALLWLGAGITGSLKDNQTWSDDSILEDSFDVSLKCVSAVSLQNLSFTEEARVIQKETDNQYYYYGLYSISSAKPGNAAENRFFDYSMKYEINNEKKETFNKRIDFNGNLFTRDKPYAERRQFMVQAGEFPQPVKDAFLKAPEDVLLGAGNCLNASRESQNIFAMTRALAEISRQVNTVVQEMERDYEDKGKLIAKEKTTVSRSVFAISEAVKICDTLDGTGQNWQVWQINKNSEAVKNAKK